MAIAVGNVSTVTREGSSTFNKAHTVGAGNGRVLVVCAGNFNGRSNTNFTNITFNGLALTKATGDAAFERHVSIWYLLNPPVGNYNLSITQTGGGDANVGIVNFTGVAQAAPNVASTSGTGSTITASIATKRPRCVLVGVIKLADNGSTSPSASAPAVAMTANAWTDTFQWGVGSAYRLNASGTSSIVWTTSNDPYGAYVVSFAPLSSAGLLMKLAK